MCENYNIIINEIHRPLFIHFVETSTYQSSGFYSEKSQDYDNSNDNNYNNNSYNRNIYNDDKNNKNNKNKKMIMTIFLCSLYEHSHVA